MATVKLYFCVQLSKATKRNVSDRTWLIVVLAVLQSPKVTELNRDKAKYDRHSIWTIPLDITFY